MAGKKKASSAETAAIELSEIEQSALGEICDLISASVTKAFSEKTGSGVNMEPAVVRTQSLDELKAEVAAPILLMHLNCSKSLEGQFFMYINGDGLSTIFDLAIPEDAKDVGADDEVIMENLTEIVNGAVTEAMTGFAESMGHSIDCSVLDTIVLQEESGLDSISFLYPEGGIIVATNVYALAEGTVTAGYLIPVSVGRNLIDILLNEQVATVSEISGFEDETTGEAAVDEPDSFILPDTDDIPTSFPSTQPVHDMQPASFNPLGAGGSIGGESSNISLLLDVMLDASIELGKTQMTIEEILRLSKGSVIELDKLASEPVEFLVNGKIIARGEVVVIDDNFGIRITEILSPRERLESI